MIKEIIIFAAGLGIGIGGSYLFLKRKFYKDLEERMNKELEPINELYDKLQEEYMQSKHVKEYVPEDSDETEKEDSPKQAKIFRKAANEERKAVRYDVISKGGQAESDDREDDDPDEAADEYEKAGLEFEESRKTDLRRSPERISGDEVGEYQNYEKVTLLYYPFDDVFIDDETREEVYNADEILGDTIDVWRDNEHNYDDVYVRSYRLATDYTIVKMDGSAGHPGR